MAKKVQQGFTLIELLIVLIILSISITFATYSLSDWGQTRQAQATLEQLAYAIQQVREEAILSGSPFTIQIQNGSYIVWQNHHLHTQKPLPHSLIITPTTIFLDTNGTINPFILYLGSHQQPKRFQLIGSTHGQLTIQKTK